MNKLRNWIKLCLLLPILVTVCGCGLITFNYSFEQDFENVDNIQICKYSNEEKSVTPLKQLSKDEQKEIWSDILALTNHRHFNNYPTSMGEYVVFITYTDGTAEVLSAHNIATVTKEGKWQTGVDYFDSEEFQKLIAKYYTAEDGSFV